MSDAIVSHVASPEYRAGVDSMTCAEPGCKRWRRDDRTPFCTDHEPIRTTIERMNHEGEMATRHIRKCSNAGCGLRRANNGREETSKLCPYCARKLSGATEKEVRP